MEPGIEALLSMAAKSELAFEGISELIGRELTDTEKMVIAAGVLLGALGYGESESCCGN